MADQLLQNMALIVAHVSQHMVEAGGSTGKQMDVFYKYDD